MSYTIYTSKAFDLTEYSGGKGKKRKMQITQGYEHINLKQIEVCKLIDKLKEWIGKE